MLYWFLENIYSKWIKLPSLRYYSDWIVVPNIDVLYSVICAIYKFGCGNNLSLVHSYSKWNHVISTKPFVIFVYIFHSFLVLYLHTWTTVRTRTQTVYSKIFIQNPIQSCILQIILAKLPAIMMKAHYESAIYRKDTTNRGKIHGDYAIFARI